MGLNEGDDWRFHFDDLLVLLPVNNTESQILARGDNVRALVVSHHQDDLLVELLEQVSFVSSVCEGDNS